MVATVKWSNMFIILRRLTQFVNYMFETAVSNMCSYHHDQPV